MSTLQTCCVLTSLPIVKQERIKAQKDKKKAKTPKAAGETFINTLFAP